MPILGEINAEFLEHNARRSYPLSENAAKMPILSVNDWTLPNNFLVAAKIVISTTPDKVNISNFYISRLINHNSGVSLEISYNDIKIGVVTALNQGQHNATFPIIALDNPIFNYGLSGHITIGSFDQLLTCLGDYQFDLSATQFDEDVVQYSSAAVTSVTVVENGVTHPPIRGDIRIVAGNNITIQEQHVDGHVELRIGRLVDNFVEINNCIKTINSVSPTDDGNLTLSSLSPCLQVTEGDNVVNISETCCEPCCGCAELSVIEQAINNIILSNNEIRLYQQQLNQQIQQLSTNLSITGV